MKVYFADELIEDQLRTHPWTVANSDSSHRYHDFKSEPELIPFVLEDFIDYGDYDAIKHFYEMLAWINGDDSLFESNDCAFGGIKENTDLNFAKKLRCSGRLMILFRNLAWNVSEQHIEWFIGAACHYLEQYNPEFEWGVVGLTLMKACYTQLPDNNQLGHELMLTFWAWGDNENETMVNLLKVFRTMRASLESITKEIQESTKGGL